MPASRSISSLEGSVEIIDGMRPFLFYFALVMFVVLTMLVLSYFLGERINRPGKNLPFESGIVSVGSAHFRISVQFYLPAILFIIFDLEVVFLFAWAVAVKEAGWPGFVEISVFIFILIAALFYLWRIRALDWRTDIQRRELKSLKGPGGVTNKKEFKL
ncbi:MAG TPA: NADH:ubiquinone oxidoreductase subunit A [Gammaproteobacteria bacterium]|nr:NADH:ubiquinone oxidoreductase subunit A [Gammaproteobacteria bacterium]HIL62009.1 NADH:ubiquinone oxidoreductase subunit A [Porticoccaceae bacterium]HIN90600.1 NADH:ubiquinone oxidoreductase subunit A [Porticoccaceae bacterium]